MRDKIIRGKIIGLMHKMYPGRMDEGSIVGIFYQYYKYDSILQALEFLTDRGYLERTELPHPYRKHETVKMYKLTPEGVLLFEGTRKDDAFIIDQEEWR